MINSKNGLTGVLAIAFLATLTACSDPRSASKSNFEKAAAAYYKTPGLDRFCVSLPQSDAMLMMFFGSNNDDKNAIVVKSGDRNEKKLDALTATGLAIKEDRPVRGNIQSFRYRLTAKAEPYQTSDKNSLCYAKVKLLGVKGYTEPAPLLGQTVSEVTLKLAFDDTVDWIKDRSTQDIWLGKDVELDAPFEQKKLFVLMNDGWSMK